VWKQFCDFLNACSIFLFEKYYVVWKRYYVYYVFDKITEFEKYLVVLKPKLIEERDILGTTFLKLGNDLVKKGEGSGLT